MFVFNSSAILNTGDDGMRNKKEKNYGIKRIIAYEKAQMFYLNFFVAYILTPIYAVISFLLIGTSLFLMENDFAFILCLGAFALLTIVFLIFIIAFLPHLRKKALENEIKAYDFNTSKVEEHTEWKFYKDDIIIIFDKYGMRINNELFYYNHLSKMVITDNYLKRVRINLLFTTSNDETVYLAVDSYTLKMLDSLDIVLDNQHILDYILLNKEDSFAQIYDKGYVIPRF